MSYRTAQANVTRAPSNLVGVCRRRTGWLIAVVLTVYFGLAASPSAHAQIGGPPPTPVWPEGRFADSDGVRIHYLIEGEGPLVLMIHGMPGFSGMWRELSEGLRDSYRVAALDLRGTGLSDRPTDIAAYSTSSLIEDVEAVIAAEGRTEAVLVGHGAGGAIAWEFALAHPEQVTGLVVLSMPHPAAYSRDLATNLAQREARALWTRLAIPNISDSGQTTLARWINDPGLRQKYAAALDQSHPAAASILLRQPEPVADTTKGSASLELNLPLLAIHGVKDDLVLVSGHDHTWDYVSADSAILRIPDAGHFVHHDKPDMVNGTIRSWLDLHANR